SGRKELGRALARETATRARQLFEADEGARRAYLNALLVDYEAAYQEDQVERMARAAGERTSVARGYDDEAYIMALLANARCLRTHGGRANTHEWSCTNLRPNGPGSQPARKWRTRSSRMSPLHVHVPTRQVVRDAQQSSASPPRTLSYMPVSGRRPRNRWRNG